jgi:fatty aldehyde-generating acyl-ACP reductase
VKPMQSRFAIIIPSYTATEPGREARPVLFDPAWWSGIALPGAPAPAVVSSPFGRAEGRLAILNCSASRLLRLPTRSLLKRTLRAGRKAARWGARIIGLGQPLSRALGASLLSVARSLAPTVTSGAGCAAAAAIEGVAKAASLMGINPAEASTVIVGAAEPLGYLCAHILARDGVNYLTLIGCDRARLDHLARRVLYDYGVACKISVNIHRAVARADLIIAAGEGGSAPEIHLTEIRPGALVCNLSADDEFTQRMLNERPDVMIFDQAILRLPGDASLNYDFGLPGADIYAPMAEAILLALEGRFDRCFLGPVLRLEKVLDMRALASKHGFILSGFAALNRRFGFEEVRAIGKAAALAQKDPHCRSFP